MTPQPLASSILSSPSIVFCFFRFHLGTSLQFCWGIGAVRLDVQSIGDRACTLVARGSWSDVQCSAISPSALQFAGRCVDHPRSTAPHPPAGAMQSSTWGHAARPTVALQSKVRISCCCVACNDKEKSGFISLVSRYLSVAGRRMQCGRAALAVRHSQPSSKPTEPIE
ncbi:uncharacterized protein LOC119308815 [Triticum dicoccoides]|uniref:uncharacterized protein LOC119308815 n=1 Tax=Triticum dicoccoides TaxID=85692 RepID=UPI001890E307|nr:uncharacterized protein LOC119308815 [Triticum dicoccoides]